jgi:WhiB family transcriptional regulator, redox-sensing transcriptional regulator
MTTTATPRPGDRPGDPKPAFERVAAAWLACEVDQGQRVDPSELAAEVSVTPRTAAATLAALRASRERDPGCARVRMLLARDQIQAAFVAAELRGDGRRLDPDELARQAGVTVTIARQWLRTLRAARASDPTLAELRAEPAEHRPATREQLAELQAAYARGGRPIPGQPPSAEQALERIEQLYRDQEQAQGRRLDLSQVARQVGVGRAYAAQTLAALRGGALTTAQRVEQLWRVVERDGGHYLADADTARMLNLSPARVRQELRRLRTGHRQPAARPADGGRFAWVKQAACRDTDPELFFPERGHGRQGTAAKQVCASCPVQGPCRDLAVKAASGRNEDHGIFGGTKPHERTALRHNPPFDKQKAWLGDRAQAEQAHQLALEVGPQQAAAQLGTYASTLRRAWDKWGLDYPGRPRTSSYARDLAQAERAFRLAEELGSVTAAAEQLGASRPALRAGWERFGLGRPDTSRVRQARQPAAARLNGAFLALNPTTTLAVRARNQAELAARVRRAEQEATLSYRVTTELTAENRWPSPSVRAWAIRQRAHHAHQRTRPRTGERRPDRYRSTLERASAHRDSSDGERDGPNEHARRQAARIRERGGAER